MNQRYLILIVLMITAVQINTAVAGEIGLEVKKESKSELKILNSSVEGPVKSWDLEIKNTGSQSYVAQTGVELFHDGTKATELWDNAVIINPGSMENQKIYFYRPDIRGNITGRVVLDYGERKKYRNISFTNEKRNVSEGFDIVKTRTYRNHMHVGIKTPKDAEKIILSVEGQPYRFEQKTVRSDGRYVFTDISFFPDLEEGKEVTMRLGSGNGRYYYTKTLELERTEGIRRFFLPLLDKSAEFIRKNIFFI